MSSAKSAFCAAAKLGEDMPQENLPSQPSHILYIRVRLHQFEPEYVQIPIKNVLLELHVAKKSQNMESTRNIF